MLITDVVEDSVDNQRQMSLPQRRYQSFEGALAAEAGIHGVEVGGVVFVRRRRGEDGRQVDRIGAQRLNVLQLFSDVVEPAEGADEDLVDGSRHARLYSLERFFPSLHGVLIASAADVGLGRQE